MKDILRSISRKAFLRALAVLLPLNLAIVWLLYDSEREADFLRVKQECTLLKQRLERALSEGVTAVKTLAFMLEQDTDAFDFDRTAELLLSRNLHVDAVQRVVGDTIVNTYPLRGNEESIGYAVMEVEKHRRDALMAVSRREAFFEGPIELKQGGRGFVGRYPVFSEDSLTGFAAVIIKTETLLAAVELDKSGRTKFFTYQLRKAYSDGEEFIFEHNTNYNTGCFASDRVRLGDWDVFVRLNNPPHIYKAALFLFTALFISAILAMLFGYLAQQSGKLERLVDQKTKRLNEANRQLEIQAGELKSANKELQQFAYVASHDLQEPLRMISSFLGLLEKRYADRLDDKAKTYIHYATDGADRMKAIINDLLDYAQSGARLGKKERVDTAAAVEEMKLLFKRSVEEKNAEIIAEELPVVSGHASVIRRVLQNLISNALKYSHENRSPVIRVTSRETESHWEISVADNGTGIPPAYFDRIFELFTRGPRTAGKEGTGIGLATVKKIVERTGGSVWLTSKVGEGSTFTFTVPKED